MSDNLPTNVQIDANQNGSVTFAADVVATIAGLAATEIEGVASMSGNTGLADILTRKTQTRNLTRGVKVELHDDHSVAADVTIVVDFGSPIPEVAYNIQENVKKAIETMSGLTVTNVDVHVQGVSFERENKSAAEIEVRQRKLLNRSQPAAVPNEDQPLIEDIPAAVAPENESPEADEDDFVLDLGEDEGELVSDVSAESTTDAEAADEAAPDDEETTP